MTSKLVNEMQGQCCHFRPAPSHGVSLCVSKSEYLSGERPEWLLKIATDMSSRRSQDITDMEFRMSRDTSDISTASNEKPTRCDRACKVNGILQIRSKKVIITNLQQVKKN